MNPERARRRRWRRWLLFGVAGLLIAAATIIGSLSLMFPWLLAHPEKVQSFLSERLQRPVQFRQLDGEWLPGGPIFRINGLSIGGDAGHPALAVERAELAVDFYAPFKRGVAWHELRIIGLAIDAERDAEGKFRIVQWRGSADKVGDPLDALRSLGAFRIAQSSLQFNDLVSGTRIRFQEVDISVGPRVGGQRVLGRVSLADGADVGVRCDLSDDFRSGDCFARAQQLPIAPALSGVQVGGVALAGGKSDLRVWLRYAHAEISEARVEMDGDELAMRGVRGVRLTNGADIEPRYSPDQTRLAIHWRRSQTSEQVAVLEGTMLAADAPDRSKLVFTRDRRDGSWNLKIDRLQLDRMVPWLSLSSRLSEGVAGWLFEAAPSGQLQGMVLSGRGREIDAVNGRLHGLTLQSTRRSPRLSGIAARVTGDGQAVQLKVDPVDTVVDFPSMFRAPLPVRLEKADVVFARDDDAILVELPELSVQGDGFGVDGALALRFVKDGRRPEIDAAVNVRPGKVVAAKSFWPISVMPIASQRWLDRGLVDGAIVSGHAVIRGDLDDWPFRNDQGRFVAEATVADLVLDYHRDWPRASLQRTDVRFVNAGMSATATHGRVVDVEVDSISGDIASFKDPVLRLVGKAHGQGPALLGFLRATPLNQRYRDQLLALSIGGSGDVDVDLNLPLQPRLGESSFNGIVHLQQADLADAKWGLEFDDATGPVRFSREGFSADGLRVLVDGDSAELDLAVGRFTADGGNQVEASLRGEMKASAAMSAFDVLDPYWNRMPGKAYWDIALKIPDSVEGDKSVRSLLTLSSDLRGIALDLPAPLSKDSESPLPLRMSIDLPAAGNVLEAQLGAIARLKLRIADDAQPFAAHLALGGELPVLPKRAGLRVSGAAPSVDLGGWSGFGSGQGEPFDLSVDVQANELAMLGRAFGDTALRIERDATNLHAELKGDGISGSFDVPNTDLSTRGLTLQFDKLHWPEAMTQQPVSRPTDPSLLPPLHIWVRDLKLGAASFGEARIETQPMAGGLRIEQFDARSPTMTMRASGEWRLVHGSERSALDITMSSESLGKMLESLGFSGVIEGGQTVARIDGSWAGSPAQFGLDRIDGNLSGEVGQGRILNVDPGAGRIFGLVNFSAIPRRLSLDFRDFFQSGMAFDNIKGSFTMADGSAHTSDLQIKGPAADIRISGRTGIRAKDYEQVMEVTPKLRGALPIVGAVAGGPVGAVVGVLAQEVMRKPIDDVVSTRYRVRGTWDKPDITLIDKGTPRQRAAASGSG